MAAPKKVASAPAGAAATTEPKPTVPELTPASEASDPAVFALLGQRNALAMEDAQCEAQISAARAAIESRAGQHEEINAQLAELGYR